MKTRNMKTTVSRWVPTTNLMTLRRLGKLGEELGEQSLAAIDCMDTAHPDAKSRHKQLANEIADVLAQTKVTADVLRFDRARIQAARGADLPLTGLDVKAALHELLSANALVVNVSSRCVIQGLDEIDPGTGRINRERLENALGAIERACLVVIQAMLLPVPSMVFRALVKECLMLQWEGLFTQTEVVGALPVHAGFYWYLPSRPPADPIVVEKRDGEDFIRFTSGAHQRWAHHRDRFVGPIESPR